MLKTKIRNSLYSKYFENLKKDKFFWKRHLYDHLIAHRFHNLTAFLFLSVLEAKHSADFKKISSEDASFSALRNVI